jgi:hypothetical protein
MITYRIEVDTLATKFFLKKEYLSLPQALKAVKMLILSKYNHPVLRVFLFRDERKIMNVVTIINGVVTLAKEIV